MIKTEEPSPRRRRIVSALVCEARGANTRRLAHLVTGRQGDAGCSLGPTGALAGNHPVDLLDQSFPPFVGGVTVGRVVVAVSAVRETFENRPGMTGTTFECLRNQQDCRAAQDDIGQERARQGSFPAI